MMEIFPAKEGGLCQDINEDIPEAPGETGATILLQVFSREIPGRHKKPFFKFEQIMVEMIYHFYHLVRSCTQLTIILLYKKPADNFFQFFL